MVDVEFGGNPPVNVEVLKENGVVATYASMAAPEPALPFYPFMFKNLALRTVFVFAIPESAKENAASDIGGWLQEGKLRHRIGSRFPLDQTAAAHEAVESGSVVGNVVVDVD